MTNSNFVESKRVLSKHKINSCKEKLVDCLDDAVIFSQKIGYPVVLKVVSPDIPHSTDIGGLKTNIKDKNNLKNAWRDINQSVKLKAPKALIEGFLVQEQLKGVEVVFGMKRSREFGPVLMFGLGGVFIEILKDVSFGIAPISKSVAIDMIKNIKGFEILNGFRGSEVVNLDSLIDVLVNLSNISLNNKNIKEIDLNPVIVNNKKALVVDSFFLYEKN